jgi:uncharacterized protein YqgC (DUF456 family)
VHHVLMHTLDIALYVLAAILAVIGLAGAILPALPGVPILFAGIWLAAGVDGYAHVGLWWLIAIGIVGALAMLLDLVASVFGAKRVGAQPAALWGSAIGTVVGLFFGLPGLLLGPFIGALAGELMSGSSVLRSTHVGVGTWVGLLLGTLAKLVLSFVMLAMFAFAMLW